MTALLDIAPVTDSLDDIAYGEKQIAQLFARAERIHRSGIGHEPTRCVLCFEQR